MSRLFSAPMCGHQLNPPEKYKKKITQTQKSENDSEAEEKYSCMHYAFSKNNSGPRFFILSNHN